MQGRGGGAKKDFASDLFKNKIKFDEIIGMIL